MTTKKPQALDPAFEKAFWRKVFRVQLTNVYLPAAFGVFFFLGCFIVKYGLHVPKEEEIAPLFFTFAVIVVGAVIYFFSVTNPFGGYEEIVGLRDFLKAHPNERERVIGFEELDGYRYWL